MKIYPISTLRDIFSLPTSGQMETCLAEMTKCMIQARLVSDATSALMKRPGAAFEWPESVDWVDDGKGELSTHFLDPDGTELFEVKVPNNQ